MTTPQKIRDLISSSQTEEAMRLLDEAIAAGAPEAWMYIERGKLHWRHDRRRQAINDYLAADRLEPGGEAAQLLSHTTEIMDYRCLDLLNP